MRRLIVGWIGTTIAILGICGVANATNVTVDNLKLTSAGNNVDNGVYVGPYTATVNNSSSVNIICDDYNTKVSVGITWTATPVTLPPQGASSTAIVTFADEVKFNPSNNINVTAAKENPATLAAADTVLQDYEAAAWLAQQITANTKNTALVGDLNYALWAIFSSNALSIVDNPSFGTLSTSFDNCKDALCLYNKALDATYNLSQFSDIIIWVPDPTTQQVQEYITVTPEPASLLLFGTGLLGIIFVTRKRRTA